MTALDDLKAKWDVQFRKGTLELVVLSALQNRTLYGLELLNLLKAFETTQITEGTLYPLLDRMKKDGLIDAKWVQEGDTRPRKYYALNAKGSKRLVAMSARWRQSVADIEKLLNNPGPHTFTQGE